jgi:peptide/nickel transport system substrate-binding protein
LAALWLVACAPVVATHSAGGRTQTLHVALPGQPNTLNPLVGPQFYENYVYEAIFSGLTVIDSRGNVIPDLAAAVPTIANGGVSRDGHTLVYRLRPNLKWQDGVPLTADDVAFTFGLMRDPKTGFPTTSEYQNVASVTARDPRTVVVRLNRPDPDIVAEIFVNGQNGSIVPRHVLQGVADIHRTAFNEHPVGSGPYAVDAWNRGSDLQLRANPNYFGGKPAIERLDVAFVTDSNTLAIKLRTGDADFSPNLSPATVPFVRSAGGLHLETAPSYDIVMLENRVTAPTIEDPRVRRALALSIDRTAIAHKSYLGFAVPTGELVPPWSPYATYRTAPLPDLAEAGRLLDAAGWRRGRDGERIRNGQLMTLSLTTIAGDRALTSAATLLQAGWRAIGIDVTIRPIQINQLYAPAPDGMLASGRFQFAVAALGFATTPDRSNVLSSASIPPYGLNEARYRNASVDAAIETARTSLDPAVRRRAFKLIADRVIADTPYAPILWRTTVFAISNRLVGVKPEPVNSDFWNVATWRWR